MYKVYLLFSISLLPLFIAAQSTGDYRSVAAGNWENASNWERYNGTAWVAAPSAPAITDGVITIRPLFGITVTTSFSIDQVVIAGGASLTISGTLTLTDGPGAELTCNGSLPITGGTLTISGGAEFVWNTGNINFNNATLNNSGMITATQNAGNLSYISGTALFTNNTGAVFEKSGGTTTSNININNDGTFRITNSDAIFNVIGNTFYNYGTIDLLGFYSTFQNSSVLNLYAGTQITGDGTLLLSSGSHILNDPITVDGPDLHLAGGTLEGAGSLTTTQEGINIMTWQGGTINATITIQSFMDIYGPVILSDTLNLNNANVEWISGNINFTDGVINNNSGSLFRSTQNAVGLSHTSGTNAFNNNNGANFEIAGGEYTTANITINNAGVFTITDDYTEFSQTGNNFNNSGTINLFNTITYFRSQAILNLNAGTQIIGEGILFLESTGFHNLNSAISVNEPSIILISGTIQGPGSLTARYMSWSGGTINAPVTITEIIEVETLVTLSDTLTITNSAVMHWGSGNINFTGGILYNNGIIYAYQDAGGLVHVSGANAFNNNGGAIFEKIGGTISTANIAVYNYGIFEVNSNSDSSAANTAFHQIGSSFNNSGTINVISPTSIFKNAAILNLNPGTQIIGDGTLWLASTTFHNLNTAVTINNTLLVHLSAGTLNGPGSLTAEFWFWTGGTINAPVTIAYNMIVQGSSFTLSDTMNILNGSLLEWNSGNIGFAGGILNNNDLILAKQSAGGLIHVSGTNTFNNNSGATFEKIGGTVSTASIPINNAGIFKIDSNFPSAPNTGFSQTGSSFNNTGTINLLGSSSTFQNSGILNLNAGTQVTGTGSLLLSSTTFHNLNTGVTITSAIVKLIAGTLQGPGLLTVEGMLWNGGTMDATVVITSTLVLQGSTVVLADTLSINSGAELLWESGNINFTSGILNNNGTIIAYQNAGALANISGTNAFNNNNGATFEKRGGTTSTASISINNSGLFKVNSDPLVSSDNTAFQQTGGSFNNSGTIDLNYSTSTFQNSGILNLNAGTQVTGTGSMLLSSTTFHNLNTGVTVNTALVKLMAGTLQGPGLLTVGGVLWNGGTIDATVVITSNLLLQGSTVVLADTLTINSGAELLWESGNINFNGGILNNNGTVIASENANELVQSSGTNAFNNKSGAIFQKTGGDITKASIPVNNAGNFLIGSGSSLFRQEGGNPFTNTGTIDLVYASSVFVSASVLNLNAGTQFSGDGTLSLASTFSHNLAVDVNMPYSIEVSLTAGTLQGAGTLTIDGNMVWQGGTIDAQVMMAEGSLLRIENNTSVSLTGTLIIDYHATAEWDDANINFTNGTLENHGTIWVIADKTMASVGGINRFSNFFDGAVIKISTGTTTINIPAENYGTIGGGGTFSFGGSLINAGVISPGSSPGICIINSISSTLFSATSVLNIEIQDTTGPGTGHDQFQRNSNLTLDGTLRVQQTGVVPLDSFTIINLTSGTLSGSFDTLNLPPGYISGQTSNRFFVIKTSNILWKYRSKQSGNWNELATWESSVDGIVWANAMQLPTEFNAELVTIHNGHTVTVSDNIRANEIVNESGGLLIISSGTLTILM